MKKNTLLKSNSLERNFKSLIPLSIKKILIKIIVNSFIGKLIKISGIKLNLFGGVFDYSTVTAKEAASIFFGIWESAEIRFAKRFALSKTIIELGSSVGVTFGVLSNIRNNTKFILVEASKKNYQKLTLLKNSISEKKNKFFLVNKAIYYDNNYVNFEDNTSITSKISKKNLKTNKSYQVKAITLSAIIKKYIVKEPYTLILDIEGAESFIFFKDEKSLKKCETIIVELENTKSYTILEQINQLEKLGFKVLEWYGNVYCFRKI